MSHASNSLIQHFQNGASDFSIARQGAHLFSWAFNGREILYLSPRAALDGQTPIRGGVPVCFPQFNMRGALAKHGFARTATWTQLASAEHPTFELSSNAQTLALWPHHFKTRLQLVCEGSSLTLHWTIENTGNSAFEWTGALHSYVAVSDIANVELQGLQGQSCWDSVTNNTFIEPAPSLRFTCEFDRVFDAVPNDAPNAAILTLQDGQRRILISQSASLAHTVVWNPGADRCAQIPDLPNDGYRHFLCVEAAQVLTPIAVPAGDTWTGWQQLVVSK